MADEKLLREQVDKLITEGYGDALWYACNEAANAATKGYTKGVIAGGVICLLFTAIIRRNNKTEKKD